VVAAPHDVTAAPIDLKTLPSVVAYDNLFVPLSSSAEGAVGGGVRDSDRDRDRDAVYGDVRGILSSSRYRNSDSNDMETKEANTEDKGKGKGKDKDEEEAEDEVARKLREERERQAQSERLLRYQKQRHLAAAWADGDDAEESLWYRYCCSVILKCPLHVILIFRSSIRKYFVPILCACEHMMNFCC